MFLFLLIDTRWWLLYPYFDNFTYYVCFVHAYNGIWDDCHTRERFSAIKPGSIHQFLHLKIPIREYGSCCPFVWCVLSFAFAIWLGTFRFEISSEFSTFVILLCFWGQNQILWFPCSTFQCILKPLYRLHRRNRNKDKSNWRSYEHGFK